MSKEEEKNSDNLNESEENSPEQTETNDFLSNKRERVDEKDKNENNFDIHILHEENNNLKIKILKDDLIQKCKNCSQENISNINNKLSLFEYIFEYFLKDKVDNNIRNDILNLFNENDEDNDIDLTDLCYDCIIKKFLTGGFTELLNNNKEKSQIKIKENLSVITESLYQIFLNSYSKKLDELNENLVKNTIETENVINKMALILVENKCKMKFQEFNEEMNRCKILLHNNINSYSGLFLKVIEDNDALKRIEDILDNSIQHNITDEKVQRLLYLIREINNKNELRFKGKTDISNNEDNIFQIQPQTGLNFDSHKKANKKSFIIKSTTPIHEIPPSDNSEFNKVQYEGQIGEKQILSFNNNIIPLIHTPTFIPTNIIIPEEKKSNNNSISNNNNNDNNDIKNIHSNINNDIYNINNNSKNSTNNFLNLKNINNMFELKKNTFQNLYHQGNNFNLSNQSINSNPNQINQNKIQDFNVNFSDIPHRLNPVNPNNIAQFGPYFPHIKNTSHSFLNDNSSFFNRNLDFNNFATRNNNFDNNNNQSFYNNYFNNNLISNNNFNTQIQKDEINQNNINNNNTNRNFNLIKQLNPNKKI